MGGSQTKVQRQSYAKVFDSFMYTPITTSRTISQSDQFESYNYSSQHKKQAQLLKTAYHGVWSMVIPDGLFPSPRIGQCHVFDDQTNRILIAYGADSEGFSLNDFWSLDVSNLKWSRISQSLLSPRQFPSSTLFGREMYIFGGADSSDDETTYFSDLHSINVDSGKITLIESTGEAPCPRTSPAIFCTSRNIIIWGGYNGRSHAGIYILPINGGEWKRVDSGISGIPAPAFCTIGREFWIFGGPRGSILVKMTNDSVFTDVPFTTVMTTGSEPTPNQRACLVKADEYIFMVGGEADYDYMHLIGFEINRKWWFAFHVRPDNVSLNNTDGIVNDIGLFMMPREYGAAVVYSKKERSLLSTMGSRQINPPPVFKIAIGDALAIQHLRTDMLDMREKENS